MALTLKLILSAACTGGDRQRRTVVLRDVDPASSLRALHARASAHFGMPTCSLAVVSTVNRGFALSLPAASSATVGHSIPDRSTIEVGPPASAPPVRGASAAGPGAFVAATTSGVAHAAARARQEQADRALATRLQAGLALDDHAREGSDEAFARALQQSEHDAARAAERERAELERKARAEWEAKERQSADDAAMARRLQAQMSQEEAADDADAALARRLQAREEAGAARFREDEDAAMALDLQMREEAGQRRHAERQRQRQRQRQGGGLGDPGLDALMQAHFGRMGIFGDAFGAAAAAGGGGGGGGDGGGPRLMLRFGPNGPMFLRRGGGGGGAHGDLGGYEDILRLIEANGGDVNTGVDASQLDDLTSTTKYVAPKKTPDKRRQDAGEAAVEGKAGGGAGANRRPSIRELCADLDAAGVDHSTCVERSELEALHASRCKGASGDTAEDKKKEQCSVCLDEFEAGQEVRRLPCMHVFHKGCVDTWLAQKSTCPVCRVDIKAAGDGGADAGGGGGGGRRR